MIERITAGFGGAKHAPVYIPEHFREHHHDDALAFMHANPFAILISQNISQNDDESFATHLPLIVRESGEHLIIRGHFAKANPHWRYLEQRPQCLIIFHGAHAYVSPANYTVHESVPTWNYGAVHAYGNARVFFEPGELLGVLHELIPMFEPAYAEQWSSLSEAYRERMLNHIVGFEISVTKLEAKFKLSQNRTKEEQENVIASLAASADTTISGVAHLMREQGLGEKPHDQQAHEKQANEKKERQ